MHFYPYDILKFSQMTTIYISRCRWLLKRYVYYERENTFLEILIFYFKLLNQFLIRDTVFSFFLFKFKTAKKELYIFVKYLWLDFPVNWTLNLKFIKIKSISFRNSLYYIIISGSLLRLLKNLKVIRIKNYKIIFLPQLMSF